MRFLRHSVKSRLILCLGLCVALLIAVGSLGVYGMRSAKNDLQEVYERNVSAMRLLSSMNAQMLDIRGRILTVAALRSHKEVPELARNTADYEKAIDQGWKQYYPAMISTPAERQVAERFNTVHVELNKGIDQLVKYLQRGAFDAVLDIYSDQVRDDFQDGRDALSQLVETSAAHTQATYAHGLSRYHFERNLIIAVIIGASLLIIVFAVTLIRSILVPLGKANALVSSIAAGNLDNDLVIGQRDEFGTMLHNVKDMEQKLAAIVREVRTNAEAVGVASEQIAQGNDDLSRRTQEQAASLEQTAASMEEMTTTVKQNADNAVQANQLAGGVRQQAQQGGAVVANAISAMEEISTSSRKITDIVSMIDDIAFQTNLLALNAAVEAARAGEQGRGFAVVAAEVRQLASRSANAAKEIKQLVEESAERVSNGSELVAQSGRTLDEIVDSIKRVASIVDEISVSSQEQASGIEQVNLAVSQMDAMTQQNAGLVEEAAASSRSLEDQAAALREQMAFFKVAQNEGGMAAVHALIPAKATTHRAAQRDEADEKEAVRTRKAAIDKAATGKERADKSLAALKAPSSSKSQRREQLAKASDDEWETF